VFRREQATGALTTPKDGNHPLDGAESVTVSPDGKSVYVPDFKHGKLAVFAREGTSAAASCRGRTATIVGTRGPDELKGSGRPDVIVARAGADVVKARAGQDIVCGGPGQDALVGGSGGDALLGGPHVDALRGGAGARDLCNNQAQGKHDGPGCER
jgi:Ca2+-binding RTX toxin-like protein